MLLYMMRKILNLTNRKTVSNERVWDNPLDAINELAFWGWRVHSIIPHVNCRIAYRKIAF